MKLVFASGNRHKLEEVRSVFPDHLTILSLEDIGFEGDIPEPYDTMEANALAKVDYLFELFGLPCFADDSGLEVRVLGNKPGVYSARYAGPEKDDQKNRRLVLSQMEGISDRSARFRAVIAYRDKWQRAYFEGIVSGRIDTRETGSGGFGYDPIFIPQGHKDSFGVLPLEVKLSISHRTRALQAFLDQWQTWHPTSIGPI